MFGRGSRAVRKMHAANAAASSGATAVQKTGMMKHMNGKAITVGAGAAVIGGLAMNRRGKGTSSGRSGMTKY
jgi:hypothetical protein